MDAEVERLVREADRPDRRFPIRGEENYGHYAGHLPDGRQALVTCAHSGEVCVFLFGSDGDYLGLQRRTPVFTRPPGERGDHVNDQELHEYLHDEFGFVPGLIRVKRFVEPAESVSIDPLPAYLREFADDPEGTPEVGVDRLTELRRWVEAGEFVLNTWNDYWLDDEGEFISS